MVKARAGNHVIFGLSHSNLDRMLMHDPVCVRLADLDFETERFFIIGWNDGGKVAVPKLRRRPIVLAISSKDIEELRGGGLFALDSDIEGRQVKFTIFSQPTESDMHEMMSQFFDEKTVVTDSRPPSQRDPFMN